MKYLSPLLLLVSITAFAGDYYEARIDTYDRVTGFYYKGVTDTPGDGGFLSSKTARNAVVNINIFDTANGTSTLLFKESQKNGIPIFVFETGFKDGKMEFGGSTYPSLTCWGQCWGQAFVISLWP